MPANIYITVEDIATQLLTYTQIRLYRAASAGGTYSLIATVDLAAGQYHYSYYDASGSAVAYYRYSFYNPTGSVESQQSDAFQPAGTTRLRIRQKAIAESQSGIVIIATAGCTTEKWKTVDYRVASELFRAGRLVNDWIVPVVSTVTTILGQTRLVLATPTPANGELSVEAWSDSPQDGDEAELHWLASYDEWNAAINRGLSRYWYLDTIPIVGVVDQYDYSLSHLPWLRKYNLHGVWWYPTGSSVQKPYTGDGRWCSVREDRGIVVLSIYPAIDTSNTLYLECSRPMPPLLTDDAQPPIVCNEDLAVALAYDEILALRSRPGSGSVQDRRAYQLMRREHARRLNTLLRQNRPRPRFVPPQPGTPHVVPQTFSAR